MENIEEKLQKDFNQADYKVNHIFKEELLAILLEDNGNFSKNKFNLLSLFKMDNKILALGIATFVAMIMLVVGSFAVLSAISTQSNGTIYKVSANLNEFGKAKLVLQTDQGAAYLLEDEGAYFVTLKGANNPIYYLGNSTDLKTEKELSKVIKRIEGEDFLDASVILEPNGEVKIVIFEGDGTNEQPSNTGDPDNNGDPTIVDDQNDITNWKPSEEYTKCLNTAGSYEEESYPPVCVYSNGEKVQ
ncbi:hypothetical protein KC660_01350 [Candidatus Dojkabacteria bacterium]|uniref:Uncharacterized protein n=1 Tax=Candidatus Dojkabacteria bacterium TaxID=2099670 RepID=A0A955RI51_9BACT|nr:hypothetical protein [Candidatus Dojkabacteria bacterium]